MLLYYALRKELIAKALVAFLHCREIVIRKGFKGEWGDEGVGLHHRRNEFPGEAIHREGGLNKGKGLIRKRV
jgi:hypothetical protein